MARPSEEWLFVPVPDAGIPREVVEAARRSLKDNDRKPSEAVRSRGEALRRLEHDRDTLIESYAGTIREALDELAPEERHRVYELLRLNALARPDWPLEITGIFAEVAEEAETSLSSCKLS